MAPREQRGLVIAATARNIKRKSDHLWTVPSSQGAGHACYHVNPTKKTCTCLDHQEAGHFCKHLFAVKFVIQREFEFDEETGTTTETETVLMQTVKKTTYRQDWSNYNASQVNEKAKFQSLLNDLCQGIQDERRVGRGRPRIPLRDAIFAAVFKVYSTMSGRRFMSDLTDAHGKGYLNRLPSFAAIFHILENEATSAVLESLIAESANPLKTIETKFAIDSSGFSGSRFDRWFDHKWGEVQIKRAWAKAHIMCGVTTNIITSCEVSHAGDSPMLKPLLAATVSRFNVEEVSADMAYSSVSNLHAIKEAGAMPLIPFRKNATSGVEKDGTKRNGQLWAKMFHYFQFKREEFLKRYHNRSNVESTFSMLKAKFGDSVRSKTDVAMKNEVLCKILCHNICCLISAMFELNLEPIFYTDSALVQKNGSAG
jgi:hypothetical protein